MKYQLLLKTTIALYTRLPQVILRVSLTYCTCFILCIKFRIFSWSLCFMSNHLRSYCVYMFRIALFCNLCKRSICRVVQHVCWYKLKMLFDHSVIYTNCRNKGWACSYSSYDINFLETFMQMDSIWFLNVRLLSIKYPSSLFARIFLYFDHVFIIFYCF